MPYSGGIIRLLLYAQSVVWLLAEGMVMTMSINTNVKWIKFLGRMGAGPPFMGWNQARLQGVGLL
jgi:hypothetical protein